MLFENCGTKLVLKIQIFLFVQQTKNIIWNKIKIKCAKAIKVFEIRDQIVKFGH